MPACRALVLASLTSFASLALVPISSFAQDAAKADPSHYKVILDNPTVRVLQISYPAGDKSVLHAHPDSIAVPLTGAKMQFMLPDGKAQDSAMTSDSAEYRPAEKHTPANVGGAPMRAILVEFKGKAPGSATIPNARENMALKELAEGPYGAAFKVTAEPDFTEPAGTKHEYDQVVIALAPTPMSLSVDGKPARTTWERGDVEFIGRGVAHGSKNTAGKPVDFILVYVK